MRTRSFTTLLLAAALVSLTGCVHQKMVIRSNPEGARVFWDGEDKGVTPAEFPFDWYGGHKVVLEKEGYERLSKIEKIKCPPHLWVPFDLVMAAIPANITDRHELSYDLTPVGEVSGEVGDTTATAEAAPSAADALITDATEAGHGQ